MNSNLILRVSLKGRIFFSVFVHLLLWVLLVSSTAIVGVCLLLFSAQAAEIEIEIQFLTCRLAVYILESNLFGFWCVFSFFTIQIIYIQL